MMELFPKAGGILPRQALLLHRGMNISFPTFKIVRGSKVYYKLARVIKTPRVVVAVRPVRITGAIRAIRDVEFVGIKKLAVLMSM